MKEFILRITPNLISMAIFWAVLVGLIGIYVFFNGGAEAFVDYIVIPAANRIWYGPPPWAGWRRGRWGWKWPRGGWGRFGWGKRWGYDPRRYYNSYVEPFDSPAPVGDDKDMKNPIYEFKPNGPDSIDYAGREPYQLLKDVLPPAPISKDGEEQISKVNSRSCYATDFKRLLESSSYRQMTNNYKHGYPDSCSAPYHELVTSFYKDDGMKIDVPKNCL
jgi:hypothetical protein